jgi:hypothetical protein
MNSLLKSAVAVPVGSNDEETLLSKQSLSLSAHHPTNANSSYSQFSTPLLGMNSNINNFNLTSTPNTHSSLFSPFQLFPLGSTPSALANLLPSPGMGNGLGLGFSSGYSPDLYLSDLKSLSRYRVLDSNYPTTSTSIPTTTLSQQARPEDQITPSFLSRSINMLNSNSTSATESSTSTTTSTTTTTPTTLPPVNNSIVSMRALSTLSSLSALSNTHTSNSSLPSSSPPPDSLPQSLHSLSSLASASPQPISSSSSLLPTLSQSQINGLQNQSTLTTSNLQQLQSQQQSQQQLLQQQSQQQLLQQHQQQQFLQQQHQQQQQQQQMQMGSQSQQQSQSYGIGLPPRPSNPPIHPQLGKANSGMNININMNMNMDNSNLLLTRQMQASQYTQMQLQQTLAMLNSLPPVNTVQDQLQRQHLIQQYQQLQQLQQQQETTLLSYLQASQYGNNTNMNINGFNGFNSAMAMNQSGFGLPFSAHPHSVLGVAGLADGISEEFMKKKRENGSSCHQCKTRRASSELIYCAHAHLKKGRQRKRKSEDPNIPTQPKEERFCRKKYCGRCLVKFYNEQPPATIGPNGDKSWSCPGCRGLCTCAACKRQVCRQEAKKLRTSHHALFGTKFSDSDNALTLSSNPNLHNSRSIKSEYDEDAQSMNGDAGDSSDESDDGMDSTKSPDPITTFSSSSSVRASAVPLPNIPISTYPSVNLLTSTSTDLTPNNPVLNNTNSVPNATNTPTVPQHVTSTVTPQPTTPSMSTLLEACMNAKGQGSSVSANAQQNGLLSSNLNSLATSFATDNSNVPSLFTNTPILPSGTLMSSPPTNFGVLSSYMGLNNAHLSSMPGSNLGFGSSGLPFAALSSSPQLLQSSLYSPMTTYHNLGQQPQSFGSPPPSPFIPPNHLLFSSANDMLPSQSPLNMYRFMNPTLQMNPMTTLGSTEGTS